MLFVILRFDLRFCALFACLLLCACQSDSTASILYDHAKLVILLIKVEIVLNSCNTKQIQKYETNPQC